MGAGGSRGGPPGWRIDDSAAMETAAAAGKGWIVTESDTRCDGSSMVATITMIQVTGSQRRQLVDVQFSGEPAKVSSLLQVS